MAGRNQGDPGALIALATALGSLGWILPAAAAESEKAPSAAPAAPAAESALPSAAGSAASSSVLGYLEPWRSIEMSASEAGVIGEIHVEEGDTVAEGDTLLSLDNRVLEAQLEIAEIQAQSNASIQVAQAELEVATDRFEKLSELKRSGTAHSSEVSRAEADQKKAKGQLRIAEEEKRIAGFRVREIEAEIERRTLRSPIDGVVLEINGEVAEPARPASRGDRQRPLVRVAQVDRLKLVVHVPVARAGELEEGRSLPVRVLLRESLASDRDQSSIDTEGTIEFVSPAIDPSSETVRTRLVVENEDGRLRSGSHALVLLEGE